MSHTDVGVRVAGMWLAIASIIQAMSLLFHGPISPDFGNQMNRIADGSLRCSIIHWAAAAALAFFAVASLIMLTTGSRLTQEWWTLSSWALVPVGALWTVNTAVAEATVIFNAAATGNREICESWWMFAEGGANGFAAMALAFTGNEARVSHRVTPHWAALIAAVAGAASLLGWVLGSWLRLPFGAPIWLVGAIVTSLWLVWFGLFLARVEASGASIRREAPLEKSRNR
ncbi:hypothetical protein GOC60_31935 [Sinorhizobium meliloti]|nr:hypothetical protein [Sinorhizobium meliloti]MDX0353096.1 hypothetical protein [Sinorhizobium meliloti]